MKSWLALAKRRERDRSGLFLIEGARELERAVQAGIDLAEVIVAPELADGSFLDALVLQASPLSITEVSAAVFGRLAYRESSDGVIGVARQFPTDLDRIPPPSRALVLVLEGMEKPGNLGSMLRTADAAGVHAVLLADSVTDPFNPNAVRASIGSLFTVPIAVASTSEVLAWLKEHKVAIVSSTPHRGAAPWDVDLTRSSAVVIGAETDGLSAPWLDSADALVQIPMPGVADSLNASISAGILLYEAVRQRSQDDT